jgi:regulator of nonsense transcripts 3
MKLPGNRRRNDARQGTIDQDSEFKEFLESLTAPITKPAAPEGETAKEEKVKTTPLIEALRERKLNKEKPQKKGRGEHKDDASEKKILAKPGKENATGEKNRKATRAEKEKAQKEAVKALNNQAALKDITSVDKAAAGPSSAAPERKRGNVNIAKGILQRDLGLGPAPNRRRGTKREISSATQESNPKQDENIGGKSKGKEPAVTPVAAVAAAEKAIPASPKKERPSRAERRAFKASLADKTNIRTEAESSKASTKQGTAPAPTILKKPQTAQTQSTGPPKGLATARVPPTGPAAVRNANTVGQTTPSKAEASPVPRPANPTPAHAAAGPAPAPMGKQAFLKHANASQGITEPLIEEALKGFGAIEKVEIDKRKGFAYVDFADPEGLRKAVAAGTVKVAQGAVQVLERKEKHQVPRSFPTPRPQAPRPAQGRGGFGPRGRGGRGGARGGHVASGPVAAQAPAATPTADVAT